jgi:Helix-turn-helix domain
MCRRDLADATLRRDSITSIAFRWGFSESSSFSRAFRNAFGLRPANTGKPAIINSTRRVVVITGALQYNAATGGETNAAVASTAARELPIGMKCARLANLWKLLPGNCTFSTIISGDFHLTEG